MVSFYKSSILFFSIFTCYYYVIYSLKSIETLGNGLADKVVCFVDICDNETLQLSYQNLINTFTSFETMNCQEYIPMTHHYCYIFRNNIIIKIDYDKELYAYNNKLSLIFLSLTMFLIALLLCLNRSNDLFWHNYVK